MRSVLAAAVLGCAIPALAVAQPPAAPTDSTRSPSNAELARRLDLLAQEIDDLQLGEVAAVPASRYGLGPAASKVYGVERGVSLGGYGEMLYAGIAAERENGTPSSGQDSIDFLRQILYFGYKFDAPLLFNSEIEFEHASTENGGSVSVEFAYIDALLRPEVNLRAGLVLVPLGLVNEMHEPPTFLGARRPETERRIIPSTWRANGIGAFGDLPGGVAYRAYVLESLRAVGGTADVDGFGAGGLRDGRQNGARAQFEDIAVAARVDVGRRGMLGGAAVFHGATAQGATTPAGASFDARTTIYEAHVDVHRSGIRLRSLFAGAHVADAASVNAANVRPGDDGVASNLWGWYTEAGYDLLSRLRPDTRFELVPYVRYEALDTQAEMPDGEPDDPSRNQQIVTAGAAFFPHPQVVLNGDYQWVRNQAQT